jgi:hypothetical protein
LRSALGLYEGLTRLPGSDPEGSFEEALALGRVAQLHAQLGQAGPVEVAYDRSIALLSGLSISCPREPKYRRELAAHYERRVADSYLRQDRLQEAERDLCAALYALQAGSVWPPDGGDPPVLKGLGLDMSPAVAETTDDREELCALQKLYQALGDVWGWMGRIALSTRATYQYHMLLEKLGAASPAGTESPGEPAGTRPRPRSRHDLG